MFFGGLQTQSIKSLQTRRSTCGAYLLWANEEGYGNGIVDIKNIVTNEDLKNSVSKVILENRYIDEETLKDICINRIANAQDAILVALPFYSVLGEELSEIINLRVTDCDFENNTILLENRDNKICELPVWVMDLLQDAISQTRYLKENGEPTSELKATEMDIIPTNYVVRYAGNRKNIIPETTYSSQSLLRRFRFIVHILGYDFLSPKTIQKSGMFSILNKIQEEREITIQDVKNVRAEFNMSEVSYFDTLDEFNDLFKK
jgi:integrase